MRDSPPLRSATGFGETFRNLDSLLFVSALQADMASPVNAVFTISVGPESRAAMIKHLRQALKSLEGKNIRIRRGTDEPRVGGAAAISRAVLSSQMIQVERVSFQSPLEIVLSAVQDPDLFSFGLLTVGGGSGAVVVFNRIINSWERTSGARVKHAEADKSAAEARKAEVSIRSAEAASDVDESEARIKAAEARVKEAEAKLRESEVELKIAAHNAIRENFDIIRTIYEAESSSAGDGGPTSSELFQRLDQAAESLVSIESLEIMEEQD